MTDHHETKKPCCLTQISLTALHKCLTEMKDSNQYLNMGFKAWSDRLTDLLEGKQTKHAEFSYP